MSDEACVGCGDSSACSGEPTHYGSSVVVATSICAELVAFGSVSFVVPENGVIGNFVCPEPQTETLRVFVGDGRFRAGW